MTRKQTDHAGGWIHSAKTVGGCALSLACVPLAALILYVLYELLKGL